MQGREGRRFGRPTRGSHLVKVDLQSLHYSSRYQNRGASFTFSNHKPSIKNIHFLIQTKRKNPKVSNISTKYWKQTIGYGEILRQDLPKSTITEQTTCDSNEEAPKCYVN